MTTILLVMILAGAGQHHDLADDDPLQMAMNRMAEAECCHFEFISILESEVFESIDSTAGIALIGADGRYDILLGPDRYVRTDEFLYSYSGENEQVTVERVGASAATDETIRFITQLDRYYQIHPIADKYSLVKRPELETDLPLMIMLSLTEAGELDRLEYIDDNGDQNKIVIVESSVEAACDSSAFVPDFPEATEIIKLY